MQVVWATAVSASEAPLLLNWACRGGGTGGLSHSLPLLVVAADEATVKLARALGLKAFWHPALR
jgi:hypothetical protein